MIKGLPPDTRYNAGFGRIKTSVMKRFKMPLHPDHIETTTIDGIEIRVRYWHNQDVYEYWIYDTDGDLINHGYSLWAIVAEDKINHALKLLLD